MVLTGFSITVYIAFNNDERRAGGAQPKGIEGDTRNEKVKTDRRQQRLR